MSTTWFRAELMDRLTHPTGSGVDMPPEVYRAWLHRDLEPALHREAYLHVLQTSGLDDPHAAELYRRVIDPTSWTPYPDTADVLNSLRSQGVRTAVVSNIRGTSARRSPIRGHHRRVRPVVRSRCGRRPADLRDRFVAAGCRPG